MTPEQQSLVLDVEILCTLLLAPWHTRHEEIARVLQTLRDQYGRQVVTNRPSRYGDRAWPAL